VPAMGQAKSARRSRTSVHLLLTAGLIIGYCGILLWAGPSADKETFPFFKWQLFSKVPMPVNTSYGVRVLEVDGVAVDPPRYFEESPDLFTSAKSPEAATLTKAWAQHHKAGRRMDAAYSQELFHTRYFSPATSVRYELVERRYDIRERVECHCYLSEEVLGEYEYG
jgi:hypothetical protein